MSLTPLAQRRRQIQVPLHALEEPVLAEVQQRRVAFEEHERIVASATSTCDSRLRDLLVAPELRDDARRELGAAGVDRRRACRRRRAHEAVDDRQVELRILRAELIDDRAGLVDQIEIRPDAAQADRPALRHEHLHRRRQHPAQADLRHPRRLGQAPPERFEVDAQDAGAAQVVDERLHLAARQADVAVTPIRLTRSSGVVNAKATLW